MERHMNFYFTRHGETEWNVKKKIQGTTDIPLDEKGIQQAKRLAETLLEKQRNGELHLDRVYTSPQLRAAETARFSAEALGIDCIRLWDLREMDLGDWEGRNWDEIRETEAERHHIWDTHRRFCHTPGGECYNEVLRRTLAALEQILAREKDDVLVVTHSAVLMALRCYLANRPFDVMREYRTRNTELVWVTEEAPGGGLPLQEGDTGYFFVREDDFVKKSAFFFVCFIQISITIFVNDFDGK